jgi:hypothetical protein
MRTMARSSALEDLEQKGETRGDAVSSQILLSGGECSTNTDCPNSKQCMEWSFELRRWWAPLAVIERARSLAPARMIALQAIRASQRTMVLVQGHTVTVALMHDESRLGQQRRMLTRGA